MDPGDAADAAKGAAKDATSAATSKVRELGSFIREQRKGAQLSLRNLASLAGVSNPYLSQIERGLRKPSAEILQAIAKGLRISAETLYVKAGILEEPEGDDLASRIVADPALTETQKRALLEVYQSFRQEAAAAGAAGEHASDSETVESAALTLLQQAADSTDEDGDEDGGGGTPAAGAAS